MIEQNDRKKREDVTVFGEKLRGILGNVLASGDWKSSLFLQSAEARFRDLQVQVDQMYDDSSTGKETDVKDPSDVQTPAGFSRVFVLLYQLDGNNLQSWMRTIGNLIEHSAARPVYKVEEYAKEFVRSKVPNSYRSGYVTIDVKDTDFYEAEQQSDQFGHPLFVLGENAVTLENIVEFIHNNKKHYLVTDKGLVFTRED